MSSTTMLSQLWVGVSSDSPPPPPSSSISVFSGRVSVSGLPRTSILPIHTRNANTCHHIARSLINQNQHDLTTQKSAPPVAISNQTSPLISISGRKSWKSYIAAAFAAVVLSTGMNAEADLNKFEAEIRGEFGIGSAAQFGSANLRKSVHANENLRRANFTAADIRESDFSGSTFNGAYFEKAVAYKTNFTGSDLSDTLMDRMVLNEANLTNAILVRSVLTRSDLAGAIIEGADFSDAVIDLPQKQALCKYASGTNPMTGMSTRVSLGCGNKKRNAYGSPSSPLLSSPPQQLLDRDGYCDSTTGLCNATTEK